MKPILAVFVVVLMLSWVVGDSLRQFIGGGGASGPGGRRTPQLGSDVGVRWDGGKLTNAEINDLVFRRRLLNSFLQAVEYEGQARTMESGAEPTPLRVERLRGPETPREGVEEHVVYTKLVSDLARKAGMRVSDEAIVKYLDELGRGRVTRDEMRSIIQRMQVGGNRATTAYILEALRDELLARNFLASYQFSLATVTPEERYKDWLRANDRIVLEAAAFPAENFLIDVPEPTDAELLAFVQPPDNSKVNFLERDPQPDFLPGGMELPSRFPGFAIPRKIDVQYIEANYDKFLTKVEGEITDEQIAKYYDEHKDLFVKLDTGFIDEPKKSSESGATDAAPSNTDESPPATDSPQPPAEAGGSEAPKSDDKSSSSNGNPAKSPFRLTAFQQNSKSVEPAATDSAPAANNDAASPASTTDDNSGASTTPPTTPAADAVGTETSAAPEKPKQYHPLDEVRDEIRHQIAGERVGKQLAGLMEKLDKDVNEEFTKYLGASLNARAEDAGPPPPTGNLADLKPLAEQNGLEYGQTGPLSFLEMRKTPVGESMDPEAQLHLSQLLFGSKDLEVYQPVLTVDLFGNRYLSMKSSDTPRRVPTLAEVRDDVVNAWKLQKAGEAALKYAEEAAKNADEKGTSLSDVFANDKSATVVRTDPFSWLTGGEVSRITGQQQPLRLSEPEGVAAAGPEFMSAVFNLDDGKAGATLNHDHSIAYVVRIADHQLGPEALRTAYLSEANTWPALPSMVGARMQENTRRLLSDITNAANIKWERPHDEVEEEKN